jgi:hypothetical protein
MLLSVATFIRQHEQITYFTKMWEHTRDFNRGEAFEAYIGCYVAKISIENCSSLWKAGCIFPVIVGHSVKYMGALFPS